MLLYNRFVGGVGCVCWMALMGRTIGEYPSYASNSRLIVDSSIRERAKKKKEGCLSIKKKFDWSTFVSFYPIPTSPSSFYIDQITSQPLNTPGGLPRPERHNLCTVALHRVDNNLCISRDTNLLRSLGNTIKCAAVGAEEAAEGFLCYL